MVLIFLIAFHLIFVSSNQFQNPREPPTDFQGGNQYQNQSPTDFGRSQTEKYYNRRDQNQNSPSTDSGSFKSPNEADMDLRKVQDPKKSSIKQNPNGESAKYRTNQYPYDLPNNMNKFGRNIKDLNESAPVERKLQDNGCKEDQYFDSVTGSCAECHTKFPKCWSCDENACHYCIIGIPLNADGECAICPDGCATCDQTGCISCLDHYYKDSDGECFPCDYGCDKCNATSCTKCNNGYFLNEFSYCSNCASTIPNCQQCSILGCQVCNAGYYLDSNSTDGFSYCTSCSLTFPNCNDCDKSGCKTCSGDTYLTPDGKCTICDENCVICNIYGQCVWCNSLFYSDENYKCQPCSSNCTSCNQRGCNSCQSGYYVDYPTCSKCPDHCLDCQENPNVCTNCENGYYWSSENKCKLCSEKFGDWCSSCTELTCIGCIDYNFVPSSNGTCAACSKVYEGCRYCNGASCMDCDTNYYRDNDGKCQPCSPGCEECFNPTSCMHCEYGWMPYSDGTCEKLSDAGTYLNTLTNTYGFCSHGCKDCNNSTSCNKCWIPGMINNGDGTCSCRSNSYVFNNGFYCQPCSDWGCKTCEVVGSTHFSVTVKCIEPMPEIKCSDRENMIENIYGQCECVPGYYLDYSNPRTCQPCLSGCAYCRDFAGNCENCFDAYYMVNNENGSCSCVGNMTYNSSTFRCENSQSENSTLNCAEYGTSGCSKCDQGHFLYDNSGVLECLSCSESCNSCDPHPGCYLCGTTIEKESSTCTSDNSVGYLTSFEDGNLILDFAYDLPEPLSLKEIIIKSPGNYDTSSWRMTQVTPRQYMISTNLQDSDLPIDVRFKFNRG